jgi:hypothetical protein
MMEERLHAALGNRYRIERELGAGGPAKVWLAGLARGARARLDWHGSTFSAAVLHLPSNRRNRSNRCRTTHDVPDVRARSALCTGFR